MLDYYVRTLTWRRPLQGNRATGRQKMQDLCASSPFRRRNHPGALLLEDMRAAGVPDFAIASLACELVAQYKAEKARELAAATNWGARHIFSQTFEDTENRRQAAAAQVAREGEEKARSAVMKAAKIARKASCVAGEDGITSSENVYRGEC